MSTGDGSQSERTKRGSEELTSSGRSAKRTAERTRYRCRYDYNRTYDGEVIDDDPTVCLECRLPAMSCRGEYLCYIRQKQIRDRRKRTQADYLLEEWKPSGIYDIWGESL